MSQRCAGDPRRGPDSIHPEPRRAVRCPCSDPPPSRPAPLFEDAVAIVEAEYGRDLVARRHRAPRRVLAPPAPARLRRDRRHDVPRAPDGACGWSARPSCCRAAASPSARSPTASATASRRSSRRRSAATTASRRRRYRAARRFARPRQDACARRRLSAGSAPPAGCDRQATQRCAVGMCVPPPRRIGSPHGGGDDARWSAERAIIADGRRRRRSRRPSASRSGSSSTGSRRRPRRRPRRSTRSGTS